MVFKTEKLCLFISYGLRIMLKSQMVIEWVIITSPSFHLLSSRKEVRRPNLSANSFCHIKFFTFLRVVLMFKNSMIDSFIDFMEIDLILLVKIAVLSDMQVKNCIKKSWLV